MSTRAGRAGRRRKTPRQGRDGGNEGRLIGTRPVLEALRAGRRPLRRLWVRETRGRAVLDEIRDLAVAAGLPVAVLSPDAFDAEIGADAPHQGVALEVGALPTLSLRELPEAFSRARVLVALDGVEDPQNLGSIARVALAAGAEGLILTTRRSPPLGPTASRASAGALEHLPVARVPNLGEVLRRLRDVGFLTVGADPEGEKHLYQDLSAETPRVLVLGAEGRGMRDSIRRTLDQRIRIPIDPQIQSLNVAAAAAVVLFEWRRRANFPTGNSN